VRRAARAGMEDEELNAWTTRLYLGQAGSG
jgi:hypothetical protein